MSEITMSDITPEFKDFSIMFKRKTPQPKDIFYVYTTGFDYDGLTTWSEYLRLTVINIIPKNLNIVFHHSDIIEGSGHNIKEKLESRKVQILTDVLINKRVYSSTFTTEMIDFKNLHAKHNGKYILIDSAHVVHNMHPDKTAYNFEIAMKINNEIFIGPLNSIYIPLTTDYEWSRIHNLFKVRDDGIVVDTYIKHLYDNYLDYIKSDADLAHNRDALLGGELLEDHRDHPYLIGEKIFNKCIKLIIPTIKNINHLEESILNIKATYKGKLLGTVDNQTIETLTSTENNIIKKYMYYYIFNLFLQDTILSLREIYSNTLDHLFMLLNSFKYDRLRNPLLYTEDKNDLMKQLMPPIPSDIMVAEE